MRVDWFDYKIIPCYWKEGLSLMILALLLSFYVISLLTRYLTVNFGKLLAYCKKRGTKITNISKIQGKMGLISYEKESWEGYLSLHTEEQKCQTSSLIIIGDSEYKKKEDKVKKLETLEKECESARNQMKSLRKHQIRKRQSTQLKVSLEKNYPYESMPYND